MTDIPPSSDHPSTTAAVMTLAVVCSLFSLPVSAAGSTAVELSPGEATVDIGNSTTFDTVVTNADGGVGAYELTLEINEPDTAQITDVTRLGDPGIGTADIASDGASADVEAGLMDTADTGSVAIVRVTIEGEANGTSAIQLSVQALGDEAGASYDVTETRDATLTAGSGSTTDTGSTSQPETTENDAGGGPVSTPHTESALTVTETTAVPANAQATTDGSAATRASQSTAESENDQAQSSGGTSTATEASDATTGPATQSSSGSTEIPGFGVLTGLLAIGTLIIIVRIRLRQ